MTTIFEFINYREYLKAWIEAHGPRAHGQKGRIARALNISSSLVSQVLKGEKTLTPDQTSELADHLGLSELETDYLHLMVEWDRAGSSRYREKLQRKLHALQAQSRSLGKRVPRQRELSEAEKALFYASWLPCGVFNLAAIPERNHAAAIAEHLRLEPAVVQRVLRLLLEIGVLREEKGGTLRIGATSMHVDRDSPHVNKHHQNWRFQAMQQMENRRDQDVFFTSPMSLSRPAAAAIRDLLPGFIQTVMKISGPSPSECVACLNLDWFEY